MLNGLRVLLAISGLLIPGPGMKKEGATPASRALPLTIYPSHWLPPPASVPNNTLSEDIPLLDFLSALEIKAWQ
jgi:hypothetical protein